mmetsp:Transcript_24505/g.68162  ORF Transcript_24505/g.68162 Transcript_24505/m.68162 type:complete len:324 (-) Transcript_24505:5459-6430(-)
MCPSASSEGVRKPSEPNPRNDCRRWFSKTHSVTDMCGMPSISMMSVGLKLPPPKEAELPSLAELSLESEPLLPLLVSTVPLTKPTCSVTLVLLTTWQRLRAVMVRTPFSVLSSMANFLLMSLSMSTMGRTRTGCPTPAVPGPMSSPGVSPALRRTLEMLVTVRHCSSSARRSFTVLRVWASSSLEAVSNLELLGSSLWEIHRRRVVMPTCPHTSPLPPLPTVLQLLPTGDAVRSTACHRPRGPELLAARISSSSHSPLTSSNPRATISPRPFAASVSVTATWRMRGEMESASHSSSPLSPTSSMMVRTSSSGMRSTSCSCHSA